jgi:MFS family permease
MPIFARDILKVGVKGLGMLMSSAGCGAVIAALLLARLGDFTRKGKFLILSCMVFSVSLILFSLSRVYLFSLITLVFMGGSSVAAIALINTLLLTNVAHEFRGRVMSAFMFTFAGIMPFGNLIAGSLSQALGVSLTVMISGIICTVFFVAINIFYPEIRKI